MSTRGHAASRCSPVSAPLGLHGHHGDVGVSAVEQLAHLHEFVVYSECSSLQWRSTCISVDGFRSTSGAQALVGGSIKQFARTREATWGEEGQVLTRGACPCTGAIWGRGVGGRQALTRGSSPWTLTITSMLLPNIAVTCGQIRIRCRDPYQQRK